MKFSLSYPCFSIEFIQLIIIVKIFQSFSDTYFVFKWQDNIIKYFSTVGKS